MKPLYFHSHGSWAAGLVDPSMPLPFEPGSIVLLSDAPWPLIVSAVSHLAVSLPADQLELHAFGDAA